MAASRVRLFCILLALTTGLASIAHASGVVCGMVRNSVTGAPIQGAGIFVRQTTGQYTGFDGATDATGHYCISGIPAGTYDLEVRLDDFQVAYRRGIVVNDVTTDVDIDARFLMSSLAPPWPNPGRNGVSFHVRIRDAGPIALTVIDVRGRIVRGWTGLSGGGEDRTIVWNFRDTVGRLVPAGRYFARLSTGDLAIVRAFSRL